MAFSINEGDPTDYGGALESKSKKKQQWDTLFSSASAEWETPQAFFDTLDAEFHFDLDAAATPQNAKCINYFTAADNALKRNWDIRGRGTKVWCNPPYGRDGVEPFVRQGYLQSLIGVTSVFLVPARIDTAWFFDWVFCKGPTELPKADEVRVVKGRIKFLKEGARKNSATFPSIVVVYRPYDERHNLTPGHLPFIPFQPK